MSHIQKRTQCGGNSVGSHLHRKSGGTCAVRSNSCFYNPRNRYSFQNTVLFFEYETVAHSEKLKKYSVLFPVQANTDIVLLTIHYSLKCCIKGVGKSKILCKGSFCSQTFMALCDGVIVLVFDCTCNSIDIDMSSLSQLFFTVVRGISRSTW